MTIRTMTGRPILSRVSEAMCMQFLGTPEGWTLCGILGLQAMITPHSRMWTILIDWLAGEKDHCATAVVRSIERARLVR